MTPSSPYRDTGPLDDGSHHVVFPTILRDPTTLERLESTLRTWSPSAKTLASPTIAFASLAAIVSSPAVKECTSAMGVAEAAGDEFDRQGLDAPSLSEKDSTRLEDEASTAEDSVIWSRWDSLDAGADGTRRRVLLTATASGAISMWDCSHLDAWCEILHLPTLDVGSKFPHGVGTLVGATILASPSSVAGVEDAWKEHRPFLAILTHREGTATSHVLLYSLRSHKFVHTFDVNGVAHKLASNKRSLITSTSSPLSLHVHSALSFLPTPFSPLLDVALNPLDGSPVFDLGQGGRYLVYATDRIVRLGRHDGEGARPGAGILSQRGFYDLDQSNDMYEDVSHERTVGEEAVRGVVSGVRAIGSYWMSRSPEAGRPTSLASPPQNLSKSAPQSTAGFGLHRVPSIKREAAWAGTVIVVDLLSFSPVSPRLARTRKPPSTLKVLAHFRVSHEPVTLVSLSPSSSFVLTSSKGQHFDVFDIKPRVAVGTSATDPTRSKAIDGAGNVWHRYRMHRGFTAAKAGAATWSPDSRLVAIGTGKGTTHVYAIQPFGGKAVIEDHLSPKLTNASELQPLSVVLSSIARIHSSPPTAIVASLPAQCTFVPRLDSLHSSFAPSTLPSKSAASPTISQRAPKSPNLSSFSPRPSSLATNFQDCLLFYPHSSTCILERLSTILPPSTTEATMDAASRGDVARLATNAVSGLSQLMKTRGSSLAPVVDHVVLCSPKAEWRVQQPGERRVVKEGMEPRGRSIAVPSTQFSAQAEIETFSRSPQVLPRSIYQSQQFAFFTLPSSTSPSMIPRPLEMRSSPRPTSSTPLPFSFQEPIQSAMQTILHADAHVASTSPRIAPAFPNGVSGKNAGWWRDAIPIRSVAPTVNDGLRTVRRELGRVTTSGIAVARRRASTSGYGEYSSSVSFEEDAVFADLVGRSEGSTAGTSEPDGESDEAWGLDGLEEETFDARSGEGVTVEIPFEDDFDDFNFTANKKYA